MASFSGTTQKCMACDKTVYLVDKLTADNRVFHKACFRCYHCKGTLKVITRSRQSHEVQIFIFHFNVFRTCWFCSLATTVRSRECCTAGLTMINSSRELAALTKASKAIFLYLFIVVKMYFLATFSSNMIQDSNIWQGYP